jgi:hypothetical protein
MKIQKLVAACLALFAMFPTSLFAATNGVIVGADVQAIIEASGAGDTLYFEPGLYRDPINFTKPLTIAASAGPDGGQIQFLGPVKFSNTGTNSIQQSFFGSTFDTTNATVSVIDSMFNAAVTANKGKLILKRVLLTTSAPLNLNNGANFEGLRVRALSTINSSAPAGGPAQILAVQCQFNARVAFNTANVWLGYNYAWYSGGYTFDTCNVVMIGNTVNVGYGDYTIYVRAGSNLKSINNLLLNRPGGGTGNGGVGGIDLQNSGAEIINTTINVEANGVRAESLSSPLRIQNSIVRSKSFQAISSGNGAVAALVFASYSLFSGGDPQAAAVAPFSNCLINADPNFTEDYNTLSSDPPSPCLHAGDPSATAKNRDGSPNTMGWSGGPFLNLANYTNNNPMVFLLTGPQAILKGSLSSIPITAAASAGH